MGVMSASELCHSPAWSMEMAWVGIRSQASGLLTTIGPKPIWSGDGPVARAG